MFKTLLLLNEKCFLKTKDTPLSPAEEISYIKENNDIPKYNLKLIVNVDQTPYIQALNEELSSAPNNIKILLTLMKSEHEIIRKNQTGVNSKREQFNPNQMVQKAQQEVVAEPQRQFQEQQNNF